jgi:VCBS repeat-containing protein
MRARVTSLCFLGLAFIFALGATPALALEAAVAPPELMSGVVVSAQPRVLPDTGVIVTDVGVVGTAPGGHAAFATFTMRGGEVGDRGMWSEQFTDLKVGDTVIAGVAETGGQTVAVTAPIPTTVLAGVSTSGLSSGASPLAAGYIWGGLHWADSALPVPYYINPALLPAGAPTSIQAAAQTWEDDPGSYMDYTYSGTVGMTPGSDDGVNVIGAANLGATTTIALCSYWYYPSTNTIVNFDIAYNIGSTFTFATNGSPSAYDVQGIGTHELGHTLHLADLYDVQNASETMYGYGVRGDLGQRTLGAGDIAGIGEIYPTTLASADSATVAEDTTLTVAAPGVLANDTDRLARPLSFELFTAPAHGTLVSSSNGSYSYRAASNWTGVDSFTYRAFNGASYSLPVAVTITVTAVNDPPIAVADVATIAEDTTLTVAPPGVLGNDTDVDGGPLSAVLVTAPGHGALALAGNGSYTYRAAPNWSGTDSFTYRTSDGSAYSGPATVTITVTAVNDAPVAADDATTTAMDTPVSVAAPGVLRNDTDIDGGALSAVLFSDVLHGEVALGSDGSFVYTPAAGFVGTDTFQYRAFDGSSYSVPSTVTLTVAAVGGVPVAVEDTATVAEDSALAVSGPGVLGNDTGAGTDPLTAELLAGPAHGALLLAADGSYTYRPVPDWFGADTFTYRALKGTVGSASATVTITVTAVNDPPIAVADSATVAENALLTKSAPGVLGNDTDIDGGALTAALAIGPSHGVLALAADGSYEYRPSSGWFGTDAFSYRAYDGAEFSAPATVTIVVHEVVAASPPVVVLPTTAITVSTPNSIKRGKAFYATGRVSPPHAAGAVVNIRIERYYRKRWRVVKRASVVVPPGSDLFRYRMKLSPRGSWRVVVSHSGDGAVDAGFASATHRVRVK